MKYSQNNITTTKTKSLSNCFRIITKNKRRLSYEIVNEIKQKKKKCTNTCLAKFNQNKFISNLQRKIKICLNSSSIHKS